MPITMPPGLAEQTEIEAYTDFVTSAPPPLQDALGISSLRTDSVLGVAVRADPSCFFNRAGGFHSPDVLTTDALAAVCDFYRKQDVEKGSIMIEPSLLPPEWPAVAAQLNLAEGGRYVKLACTTDSVLAAADSLDGLGQGLHVGLVRPDQAHEWATVMMTTFGFAPALIDMAASCVGRADWQQYAVWQEDRIVAVGSVYFNGQCADMFGATTRPEGRGRGAQSALLVARARAAQAVGCQWITAETGAEDPGDHNTSLHNMLRMGFQPLYERVTWRWDRQPVA